LVARIVAEEHLRPDEEEARRDALAVALLDRVVGEEVARDLLEEETVDRHVGVDRVDDPVPVAPRLAEEEVLVEAVRVGVARKIEPMASPTLAEARGGEEIVDDAFEGIRAFVAKEATRLVGRRGKAHEREVDAAKEG